MEQYRGEQKNEWRWWQRRWILWVGGVFVLLTVTGTIAVEWGLRQMQPLMRRKVVETLSARFHSPVELDRLELSVQKGVIVTGGGLRILYLAGPTRPDARPNGTPMVSVNSFEFRTGLRELLRPTTRVVLVKVEGLEVHIPPKKEETVREEIKKQPAPGILLDRIECTNAKVVLETRKPGKEPLVFSVSRLILKDVGVAKPLNYEAELINPKPVGDIRSTGRIGPWQSDEPRDTPVEGTYAFTHVDLASIKGIGGTLASTGKFSGTLGEITADGITDTPDFRLDISERPVFLHTQFHAVVDGTTGDVQLNSVAARLGHSGFTATGAIVQAPGAGHNLDLNVVMDKGRIEDLLVLAMKANPPLMRGAVALKARIRIPPGKESVTRKMKLEGTFAIRGAILNNPKMRQQMDTMSERAQGKPHMANAEDAEAVTAAMTGRFSQANAVMDISDVDYRMPGAEVKMDGQVRLIESTYDFQGTVRTQATASQMTTGWKSLLLKPFDGLLKKNGAGVELPVKVTGTRGTYDVKLNFPHSTKGPGARSPDLPPAK